MDKKNLTNEVIPCSIYARISTLHEEQVLALDNQLSWYDAIIEANPNYREVGRYIDEGITGTSAKKRDGFMRMLKDAKAGKFKLLITREVSRFARNTEEALKYVKQLRDWGVTVHFVGDGIRTDDKDSWLRLTIMAAVAEEESRKISQRVRYGQNTSRQKNVMYGNGNVLGYDRVETKIGKLEKKVEFVINPEQAETVRMIYKWYLEGNGVRKIQFLLEQAGRKTAMGKTNWDASCISRILRRRVYCGQLEYGQSYVKDFLEQKRQINYGENPKIVTQGNHEPIVSVEDFEKVQEIMDAHRKELPNLHTGRRDGQKKKVDVWTKKLRCVCGHAFNRHKWAHKDARTVYGYQCYSSVSTGSVQTRLNKGLPIEGICRSPMIPQWKLKMMAKFVLTNFITDVDEILRTANTLIEKHIAEKPQKPDNSVLIASKEKEFVKLEKRLKGLKNMRADGEITRDEFIVDKAEIEQEMTDIQMFIQKLKAEQEEEPDEVVDYGERIKMLEYALEQLVDFKNCDDIPEAVVDAFVDRIIVSEDSYDWYLRFNPDLAYQCKVEGKRSGSAKVTATFAIPGNKKQYAMLGKTKFTHVAELVLDKEYAKEYLYKDSTKHRVHRYKDTKVNVYV